MTKSDRLWGGRFTEKPHETFSEFNDSFRFDRRLFYADVRGSIAHARGLERAGVLTGDEANDIVDGLNRLLKSAGSNGGFFADEDAEDVHSFIESRLIADIGDTGRKLHTGRSRNDQVATAFRLWLRDEIDEAHKLVRGLQQALVDLAERHRNAVIPGYTHLQRAQPILLAHWCLAYFEMLARDLDRFTDARKRVNVMPLGAGALAGTGYPIERDAVAAELGFSGICRNSLDAVSDRDFAIEFISAASTLMMHVSRMAEDIIIYCSTEFGFITLSDTVSSGSSLMPQKKNPDALELLRGKAGRVFGHNLALLTVMKGLPLAYNKDMQEDKEAVFDTVDTVKISLQAAAVVIDNATLNEERARTVASTGFLNATELADYLVKRGVPFRAAHEQVGELVLKAAERGVELHELGVEEMQAVAAEIRDDVYGSLSVESALAARSVIGGTSPERVAEELEKARKSLSQNANNG